MRSPRHAHTTAIKITFAVLLTAALAACSSDSDLPPPASATPPPSAETPSLNLTPAEQQAVEEAQALFDDFMTAYVEVSTADLPTAQTAEDTFSKVERHSDALVPQQLRSEIVGRWTEGKIMYGTLHWSIIELLAVDLNHQIDGITMPRVDLRYCIDATEWSEVDPTNKASEGEKGSRTSWTFSLAWHDDWGGLGLEGWRVIDRIGEQSPC